jgi:hypothetical protein
MTHLAREELVRWHKEGEAAQRERVVGHLATCDRCGTAYADLIRTLPAEEAPTRFEPIMFQRAGYRAYRAESPHRSSAAIFGWPLRLAAAIVLSLGAGMAYYLTRPPAATVLRGTEQTIQLLHPVDQTLLPSELGFQWRMAKSEGSLRLTVFDLSRPEKPVIDRQVEGSTYKPTGEEQRELKPGNQYRWFVQYTTKAGGTETSAAARFSVR